MGREAEHHKLNLRHGKDALLLVEREVMLGQLAEHLAEALVMDGGVGAMHHNVIQVNGHSWDASEDGRHDLLETAGSQAQTERHAGVVKNTSMCEESIEVPAFSRV